MPPSTTPAAISRTATFSPPCACATASPRQAYSPRRVKEHVTRRPAFNALAALLVWLVGPAAAPAASASTFTVPRADDPIPGTCDVGDCSLREAIMAANASAGPD